MDHVERILNILVSTQAAEFRAPPEAARRERRTSFAAMRRDLDALKGDRSDGDSAHTTTRAEQRQVDAITVSYTHLRAHETLRYLVCRLLLEKKK